MKAIVLALPLVGVDQAANGPRATIDCGSLSGNGVVRVELDQQVYVVHVQCGRRA